MIKIESLRVKLKEATLPLHQQIERNVFAKAVLQGNASLEVYVQWLIRFYGFYSPVEIHASKSNFVSLENIHLKDRLKTPLLHQDLKGLGQTDLGVSCYAKCCDLPQLSDASSLLGYLYVVEGSTLGGQFIVNRLKHKYGFKAGQGCMFFNSYGDRTEEMWNEFCSFLNRYPCDDNQEKIVIQSACDTFQKLNSWLNSGEFNE